MDIPREACREPESILGLVSWDLNRDGRDDVFIQNAACGPWSGLADEHEGFALSPANALIPSPLRPEVETHVLRRQDGGELLVTLSITGIVSALARGPAPASEWTQHRWTYPEGAFVTAQTTAFILDRLRSANDKEFIVMQLDGAMGWLSLDTDRIERRLEPISDNVQPYLGFDHFQSLPGEACAAFAVGVGVYSTRTGVKERPSLVLREVEGDRFVTETLPFDGDVISQRAFEAMGLTWVVGLVRKDGGTKLELVRLGACADDVARVASAPVPFALTQVVVPRADGATFFGPELEGTLLIPVSNEGGEVQLAAYDGRIVHVYTANVVSGTVSERHWRLP